MLRTSILATALLAGVSSVEAFWRLPCGQSLVIERADPIISPGAVSGHTHNILGGSNFALSNTFEQMRDSECTSCLVKQDKSAYWTPQLYFQWANGSFTSVPTVGGGLIYYLPRYHSSDTTTVQAFPDGLRMLNGNPFKRSYNPSSLQDQSIGWNCLGADVSDTRQPQLPAYNCPNGLRGEIRFPSCWDGKNLDSSDHSSHMAFSNGESGPCPATHPIRIVTLFYEIMYSVNNFNKYRSQALNTTQPFVLAMGDATGYGWHGDFLNGWDRDVLQTAINTCTSDTGIIEYCDVFDLYDSSHTCRKTPDVDEAVTGTLASLPGCNPVTGWGPDATPCSISSPGLLNGVAYTGAAAPVNASVPSNYPSVLTSYTSTSGNQWSYQECYSDLVNGARVLPNGLRNPNQTVQGCLESCSQKNYSLCGLEYHGECWGANTLGSGSTVQSGQCGLVCTGANNYCGGSGGPTGATFSLYKVTGSNSSSLVTASASSTASASKVVSSSLASNSSSRVSTASSASSAVSTASVSWQLTSSASTVPSSVVSSASTKASSTVSSLPAASATSTVPANKVTTNSDWSYHGCFQDLINSARSLPNQLVSSPWTIETCLAYATKSNYSVAGMTYGGECWAANAISPYAAALDDSKCNMGCNNEAGKTCGGNGALQVYYSNTQPQITAPSYKQLANYGDWTYSNCYSDLVNNTRSLPGGYSNVNKTVEACLASCEKGGAKICGLSYYGECYGSTKFISSTASVLDDSKCRYPCKGNPLEMCGGANALSVWNLNSMDTASTNAAVKVVAASSTVPDDSSSTASPSATASGRLTLKQRQSAAAAKRKRNIKYGRRRF
ncbi:hypothetical protein JCM11641_006105 [Rhodosporidiobolus odoratus]